VNEARASREAAKKARDTELAAQEARAAELAAQAQREAEKAEALAVQHAKPQKRSGAVDTSGFCSVGSLPQERTLMAGLLMSAEC